MRRFFVLLSFALVGCLQAEDPHQGVEGAGCGCDGTEGHLIGNHFRGYSFPNCDDQERTFEDLPPGNVVLFNISTGWCVPCRQETPDFQAFYEEHADEGLSIVQVLAETDDTSPGTLDFCVDWRKAFGLTYEVLFDPGTIAVTTFFDEASTQMPLNLLLDRSGCVTYSALGTAAGWEAVEEEILDLLR